MVHKRSQDEIADTLERRPLAINSEIASLGAEDDSYQRLEKAMYLDAIRRAYNEYTYFSDESYRPYHKVLPFFRAHACGIAFATVDVQQCAAG